MNKIVESERCQCCCRKDLIHAPETDRRHKMPEKPGTCAHAEIKEDEVGSGSLGKARARHHGERHCLAHGLKVAETDPQTQSGKKQNRSAVGLGQKVQGDGSQAEYGHKEHVFSVSVEYAASERSAENGGDAVGQKIEAGRSSQIPF